MLLIEAQNFTNRGYLYRYLKHPFSDTWMYFFTPATLARILGEMGLKVKAEFFLAWPSGGLQEPIGKILNVDRILFDRINC